MPGGGVEGQMIPIDIVAIVKEGMNGRVYSKTDARESTFWCIDADWDKGMGEMMFKRGGIGRSERERNGSRVGRWLASRLKGRMVVFFVVLSNCVLFSLSSFFDTPD